jgi:hypothetical protein
MLVCKSQVATDSVNCNLITESTGIAIATANAIRRSAACAISTKACELLERIHLLSKSTIQSKTSDIGLALGGGSSEQAVESLLVG